MRTGCSTCCAACATGQPGMKVYIHARLGADDRAALEELKARTGRTESDIVRRGRSWSRRKNAGAGVRSTSPAECRTIQEGPARSFHQPETPRGLRRVNPAGALLDRGPGRPGHARQLRLSVRRALHQGAVPRARAEGVRALHGIRGRVLRRALDRGRWPGVSGRFCCFMPISSTRISCPISWRCSGGAATRSSRSIARSPTRPTASPKSTPVRAVSPGFTAGRRRKA